MKIQYDPEFLKQLKKLDVKIRKNFKERILLFIKDPQNPELRNHELRNKWKGYRSIDITSDYRAIYEELTESKEPIAYFLALGTHQQLYGKRKNVA